MALSDSPPRIQSWITPDFAWVNLQGAFTVIVSTDDKDIVEFISKGSSDVTLRGSKNLAAAMSALVGGTTLRGQLHKAVWDPTRLRPVDWRARRNTDVVAYFVAAVLLPRENKLGIVVTSSNSAVTGDWLSAECKAKADELLRNHQIAMAAFDKEVRIGEREIDEFYSGSEMGRCKGAAISQFAIEKANQRPILTAQKLLPLLPRGVIFDVRTSARDALRKHGIAAIARSGSSPSRDGFYTGVATTQSRRRSPVVLTWAPHFGPPSYPEVRAAVQARVPSALHKRRLTLPERPGLGSAIGYPSAAMVLDPGDRLADIFEPLDGRSEALDDLRKGEPDASSRAQRLREELETRGFEAIAWYQSYHVWTEETWGIYFDASKLDDFAYSIFEDLRSRHLNASRSLAAFLAFGLTQAHEVFHARVEAAASWLELSALQGRHLRYNQGVYEKLRDTPDWLEEALANWSAWEWFRSDTVQSHIAKRISIGPGLDRVIKASLDISPPGYRDWRKGSAIATWRTFVTQLASGKPSLPSPGIGLPLDSAITGPLPYEFRSTDIPLRFLGTGVIADRLLSHPASFHVPTHREVEKALKHFKHEIDPSGGKGGHQKWTGPDRRAFILPTRDPVSPGVFKTFLHHVGIDKATYVNEIRPNL